MVRTILHFVAAVLASASAVAAGEEPRRPTAAPGEASAPVLIILPDLGPVPVRPRPSPKAVETSLEDIVEQCISADMSATATPGAAVALQIDGGLRFEQGYGVRRHGWADPVDAHTVFRIGSVTKMMTAAGVLQQVELGRVDLDAAVTDYVPEFATAGEWRAQEISVWNLLTHTSGIPDRIIFLGQPGENALSEWAATQGGVPLHAPPGAFWNYTNPGYALAGLVLERASGVGYRTYLETRVWSPAGMTSATFDPEVVVAGGNYAWGHSPTAIGEWQVLRPGDVESWWAGPAGWAFATAGDLVRFADLLMDGGGEVLSAASAAAMQAPQVWCHVTPTSFYGYGISRDRYRGLDIRYHDGSLMGWGTILLWVPERNFAVAVVGNTAVPLFDAAFCIVDAVLEPPGASAPECATSHETWRRYEGAYDVMDYLLRTSTASVSLASGGLVLEATQGSQTLPEGRYPLVQACLDTFVADLDGDGNPETDLTFIAGQGNPSQVRWLRNRYAVGGRLGLVRSRPGARVR